MRGAHGLNFGLTISRAGSPPHARGPLLKISHIVVMGGITPACAGPTAASSAARISDRDHPRMRGAHALFLATL